MKVFVLVGRRIARTSQRLAGANAVAAWPALLAFVLASLFLGGCSGSSARIEPSQEGIASVASPSQSYVDRGKAAYAQGQLDEAVQDFTDALSAQPLAAEAYMWRSVAYYRKAIRAGIDPELVLNVVFPTSQTSSSRIISREAFEYLELSMSDLQRVRELDPGLLQRQSQLIGAAQLCETSPSKPCPAD
jgi:tetratricopeptide (TPR) repeat protein